MRPSLRAHTTVRMMAEGDENPHARGMAIATLGLLRDPNDVPVLVDALSDPEHFESAEVARRARGYARASTSTAGSPAGAATCWAHSASFR